MTWYTDLISKTVFLGFIAAWFFADSPIRRSLSVKETNEGVVKLPCSLATFEYVSPLHREKRRHVKPKSEENSSTY